MDFGRIQCKNIALYCKNEQRQTNSSKKFTFYWFKEVEVTHSAPDDSIITNDFYLHMSNKIERPIEEGLPMNETTEQNKTNRD